MKTFAIAVAICLILVIAYLPFTVIHNVRLADCAATTGVVTDVWESTSADICLEVPTDGRRFYINRGLEQGLTIDGLREALGNAPVHIYFVDKWTPLDPASRTRHISKIVNADDQVVFDETVQ